MTEGDRRKHRPALAPAYSTSSSQGTGYTSNTSDRDFRGNPGADTAEMPRAPRSKQSRSDAGNPLTGPSSTFAAAGGSFSEATPIVAEEKEERRHNRLGYQRTTVACSHCRRRKIRCEPSENEPSGRCVKCIKWDKECIFEAADPATTAARSSRSRRDEGPRDPSESPSASAVSGNLNDQEHFEPTFQGSEMRTASPQGYHSFGDAHSAGQWYPSYNVPRPVYHHSYGVPAPSFPTAAALPGMDPVSSYSTGENQGRRYSTPYQHGQVTQPATIMVERNRQRSPGPSYVTSANDSRYETTSRPPMYSSYVNPSHPYPSLEQHHLPAHPQHAAPGHPPSHHEISGPMPLWHSMPPTSIAGASLPPFGNGLAPSWDMSMQYEPQYPTSQQQSFQH